MMDSSIIIYQLSFVIHQSSYNEQSFLLIYPSSFLCPSIHSIFIHPLFIFFYIHHFFSIHTSFFLPSIHPSFFIHPSIVFLPSTIVFYFQSIHYLLIIHPSSIHHPIITNSYPFHIWFSSYILLYIYFFHVLLHTSIHYFLIYP
jgi:hypothetical protein